MGKGERKMNEIETTIAKLLERIQKECEQPNSDQEGIYFLALALKEVNAVKNKSLPQ